MQVGFYHRLGNNVLAWKMFFSHYVKSCVFQILTALQINILNYQKICVFCVVLLVFEIFRIIYFQMRYDQYCTIIYIFFSSIPIYKSKCMVGLAWVPYMTASSIRICTVFSDWHIHVICEVFHWKVRASVNDNTPSISLFYTSIYIKAGAITYTLFFYKHIKNWATLLVLIFIAI